MTTMMKSFSMNKVLGTIKRKPTFGGSSSEGQAPPDPNETPEATAARFVKQFCESGGSQTGDDITFLPPIVDAAESSPAAAAECARVIRKFLRRDYWSKPSFQYNAIMLVRILADNPGPTFTRNLDKKFTEVTKELLRSGRDPSVRQILMETLDTFETTRGFDEGLGTIIEMWKKEKEKAYKAYGGVPNPTPQPQNGPAPSDPRSQEYFSRSHSNRRIPNPVELANRLEEARTSAKLLEQVVACTPPSEVLSNDLIKEFADRCLSASRSIQGYMTSDPTPDNDTMESLIDTNEQLQRSLNQHQRAVLQAKKQLGLGERSSNSSPTGGQHQLPPQPPQVNDQTHLAPGGSAGGFWQSPVSPTDSLSYPPPAPSRKPIGGGGNGKGKENAVASGSSAAVSPNDDEADPFRDPVPESGGSSSRHQAPGGSESGERLSYDPYRPSVPGKETAGFKGEPVTPVSDEGLYSGDAYGATPPKKTDHVYRY